MSTNIIELKGRITGAFKNSADVTIALGDTKPQSINIEFYISSKQTVNCDMTIAGARRLRNLLDVAIKSYVECNK